MNNLIPEHRFFDMLMPLGLAPIDGCRVKMGKTIKQEITNGMIQIRKEDKNVQYF